MNLDPAKASSAATATSFLEEASRLVDPALEAALVRATRCAPRLAEAMRYSVFPGGKRLRPALAIAACRSVGGRDEEVLPFAAALELVHTYSLIHDDLPSMDDDDLRRGRPTSHKVHGEALAILAGDALHTLAFEVILEAPSYAVGRARSLAIELARAAGCEGMVAGQVEDLDAGGAKPDAARIERIHQGKTAALIAAACRGGGVAGGGSNEEVRALQTFGDRLGHAFQIVDDILDETGTAESLGKTPGKDRRREKMTYVALEGLEKARARAEREASEAFAALRTLTRPTLLLALARFVLGRDR